MKLHYGLHVPSLPIFNLCIATGNLLMQAYLASSPGSPAPIFLACSIEKLGMGPGNEATQASTYM